jgi:hypothetical protein
MAVTAGKGRKTGTSAAPVAYLVEAVRNVGSGKDLQAVGAATCGSDYPNARFVHGRFVSATFSDEAMLAAICK